MQSDDDIICPHCKTSKYRNPSMKLHVNVCGHSLCANCIELLFLKGTANCEQCGLLLKKSSFRLRLFEDDLVEKEIDIRRRILKDFNKKEDDFDSTADYDNYLEQVETIIFNLTNNIDVDETKKMIDDYKKKNADLITKNRIKMSEDELYIEQLLEEEKEKEQRRKRWQMADENNQQFNKMKKLQKEALIDDMISSNLSATQLLETHVNDLKLKEQQKKLMDTQQIDQFKKKSDNELLSRNKPSFFSTGIQLGKAGNLFKPIPKDESKPFVYKTRDLHLNGPKLPTIKELINKNYLNNVRAVDESERAGGFEAHYSCSRALLDAFCGLYFQQ